MISVALIVCWTMAAQPAPAAAASADDKDRARALFEEAAAARGEGRWADVRRLLEESIAVFPQFATAWNLVTAEERLDDLPAAEALLIRIRDGEFGALETKERSAVLKRLERVSRELGTLLVEVTGQDATIEVDGVSRGPAPAAKSAALRVTAGTHLVVAVGRDGRRLERSLDVARGAERTVRLSFPAALEVAPSTLGAPILDPPPEPSPSAWSSPWLWGAIGAAVVGGAVLTVVVLSGRGSPLPADFVAPPL